MRIKVHQIDNKLDRYNTGFRSYDSVMKTAGRVDPSIYKTVYDGNVDADNLEAIYTLCNTDHPVGYNGHSMSVGDVGSGAAAIMPTMNDVPVFIC